MRFFTLIFSLLFFVSFSQAQSHLRAGDAWENNWVDTNGEPEWHEWMPHAALDSLKLVLKPRGVYTEIDLFAVISQGDAYGGWHGDMEVVWQFRLPAHSIVTDSWLWMPDGQIVQADMVDLWTAQQLYDDIVGAPTPQDPSLLYQLPDGRYEIRIFPLWEGTSRKLKMTFMVPNQWTDEVITSDLLLPLMQSTDYHPEWVEVIVPHETAWANPKLSYSLNGVDYQPGMVFTTASGYDTVRAGYLSGEHLFNAENLQLRVDAPWSDVDEKIWTTTYEDGDEHFYQLAFRPDYSGLNADATTDRLLVLVDGLPEKTSVPLADLLRDLSDDLLPGFGMLDSVQVMTTSADGSVPIFSQYQAMNASQLEAAADALELLDGEASNLQQLLLDAFAWMGDDPAQILLLSANDGYNHPTQQSAFLDTILPAVPDQLLSFHILDAQDQQIQIFTDPTVYSEGNRLLFQELNANTPGELYEKRYATTSPSEVAQSWFPALPPLGGLVDLDVDLNGGIPFLNYPLHNAQPANVEDFTYYQVGRYAGDFTGDVTTTLFTDQGSVVQQSLNFDAAHHVASDTVYRKSWYGNHLRLQTFLALTPEDHAQVALQSIEERVLIPLTAFLALEPALGGEICVPCMEPNVDIIIATDDPEAEEERELVVLPNPVREVANILLRNQLTDAELHITDSAGRTLAYLRPDQTTAAGTLWTWTPEATLGAGTYQATVRLEDGEVHTARIVLVR